MRDIIALCFALCCFAGIATASHATSVKENWADGAPATAQHKDAGAPLSAQPPTTKEVRNWAKHHLDKRMHLQVLSLGSKEQPFVLLLAYEQLPDWNDDTVKPTDVRGGARLFVFASPDPVEIHGHGFLSPDDEKMRRERAFIDCGDAEVYHLSREHEPTVVAQACTELNEYITRFLVFGPTNRQEPAIGKATSRPGIVTKITNERFVPGDLPWTKERSRYRGDGKTLVEGQEFEGKDTSMRTRSYRIEWNGQRLDKVSTPWRSSR
jgi:hypothetical protein